jgi:hypothetical protein
MGPGARMKWVFAKNEGGRDSGFHDAGVETFKGNFDRYLARELIQNSLDARYDHQKPVQVKFELAELKRSEIPDLKSLAATFERCAEFWTTDKKAVAFFNNAKALAGEKTITALKVSDFNTTGVTGSDTDRKENYYNLIRCAGSSAKTGDEGGSFGIGKNAPFAASNMRTVFYSTYNKDKQHIFIGVAMLVSHSASGVTHQPTGYLGGKNGASVRSKDEIPPAFLRSKLGTDITVLGFPRHDSWEKDLVFSVLENFWPAIECGDLTVTVGAVNITRNNLGELLERFSGAEDFTAHLYYKAFTDPSASLPADLPLLKDSTLYLLAGDNDLPKKVAMVRKTGMVVFAKPFRSVVPFCGVFICKNDTGNKRLRDMEPPRHDVWDPDHPQKKENSKIEAEYVQFIRQCIRSLTVTDDAKVIPVPGLSRFLPDDDETEEEAFDSGDERKDESTERSRLPEKITGKKIDPRRTAPQPDQPVPGEGDEEEGGERSFPEGDGGGGGGGGGKDAPGGTASPQSKPVIPIRYRTFATNLDAGVYALTVQSEEKRAQSAIFSIWIVGDQGKVPAELLSARLQDGRDIPVSGNGLVGPVTMPNKKNAVHLEIKLREPLRLAMEVSAHEADE